MFELKELRSGCGVAYVYMALTNPPTAVALTVTNLLPVVAVVLGAAVLGETIGPITLLGTAIVLPGVALTRRLPAEARAERTKL